MVILPCGVSNAPNRPRPGRSSVTSDVTRPLRKLRASSPPTLTAPRSGRNAAFITSISWLMLQRNVCRHGINDKARHGLLRARQAGDVAVRIGDAVAGG